MADVKRGELEPTPVINRALGDKASLVPDAQIDPVNLDLERPSNKAYMDRLAWLHEKVELTWHGTGKEGDTTRLLTISVNGTDYNFIRDEPKMVPRFVVERIVVKEDEWEFGHKLAIDGQAQQVEVNIPRARFPHSFNPQTLEEQKWYKNIRARHY